MSTASAHDSLPPAAHDGEPLTDDGLLKLISFGLILGTPVLFVVAVVIAVVSGVGMGNALAIGVIPGLFGGVTFGGFVGLMRHLSHEDRAADAARSARSAARAAGIPETVQKAA